MIVKLGVLHIFLNIKFINFIDNLAQFPVFLMMKTNELSSFGFAIINLHELFDEGSPFAQRLFFSKMENKIIVLYEMKYLAEHLLFQWKFGWQVLMFV